MGAVGVVTYGSLCDGDIWGVWGLVERKWWPWGVG